MIIAHYQKETKGVDMHTHKKSPLVGGLRFIQVSSRNVRKFTAWKTAFYLQFMLHNKFKST